MHVKRDDIVQILSGKNKGKKGKVLEVSPKEKKVIIEGCNLATKHVKPKRQGQSGGIIKVEAPIYACKVMLVCSKCGKPTRVGTKILKDGSKHRVCKHKNCEETF